LLQFAGNVVGAISKNIRFCCRRFGWQLADFLVGFVSLNDDCFHNIFMNNIQVAQLQIASIIVFEFTRQFINC